REAQLAAAAGTEMGGVASDPAAWPIAAVVSTETAQRVDDLGRRARAADLPQSALVLPVRPNLAHHLAGVLVAGVSPHQELDGLYRGFFDLITAQLATAIATARAYEHDRRRAPTLSC